MVDIGSVQSIRMTRQAIPRALLLLACLAAVVVVLNIVLRPTAGTPPTVTGVEHELAAVIALKLATQGYVDPITVSCAPPPGSPPQLTPVNLVCQVTAYDRRRPSKSPMWFEDVTCDLPVPAGTRIAARAAATPSSSGATLGPRRGVTRGRCVSGQVVPGRRSA